MIQTRESKLSEILLQPLPKTFRQSRRTTVGRRLVWMIPLVSGSRGGGGGFTVHFQKKSVSFSHSLIHFLLWGGGSLWPAKVASHSAKDDPKSMDFGQNPPKIQCLRRQAATFSFLADPPPPGLESKTSQSHRKVQTITPHPPPHLK